jgi:uncharacterized protein (TIGR03083 family)
MADQDLQPLVASTYIALADLLASLPAQRWDTPSLCEDWRVREVVAHLTMPARYNEDAFMAELGDDEFDFTRLSNRLANRDADLPTADLVGNLRDEALHHWTPPGGGQPGALNHVVVHALDITVPLGEARSASDDAARRVLEDLTEGGIHAHFATEIDGRNLQATDIGWSFGTGPALSGTAADLILHMCGRSIPADRLHGKPLATLS